jgi:hypothetical protein
MAHAVLSTLADAPEHLGAVVLTGTAGDGKSHLCGRVWEALGGDAGTWALDDVYFRLEVMISGLHRTLHVVRDLTALPDRDPAARYDSKAALLVRLSDALFEPGPDLFLLAANDGQLIETWRRLGGTSTAARAHALFEARLMEDDDPEEGHRLRFFNLSSVSSAEVLTLALDALLGHEGWLNCYEDAEPDGFFGPRCPIRRNYELLGETLVRARLKALFRLCDFNELHTPIRRVLMLLANAVLGHPAAKDRLMSPRDVRGLVRSGDVRGASIFSNLFGANLSATKRESLEIFEYLARFGIGQETTNRIDNILVFGAEDEALRPYYDDLIASDTFYGGTERFRAEQRSYVEAPEGQGGQQHPFLDTLTEQRRALFFRIPDAQADELKLWRLTVFSGAGEYLDQVAAPLLSGGRVARQIVAALVRGLNRIFTGLLVSSEREILLATSLSFSGASVSQLLEDRIAVSARGRQERIEMSLRRGFPHLDVHLPNGVVRSLRLNLTRYEFLMRVSEGALPGNFSRECHEDILAFKSALLVAVQREQDEGEEASLTFRLLSLDAAGNPVDEAIEVSSG